MDRPCYKCGYILESDMKCCPKCGTPTVQNEKHDKRAEITPTKILSENLKGNVDRLKHLNFLKSINRKAIIVILVLLGVTVFSVGGKAAYDKSQRDNVINSALAVINQTSTVDQSFVKYGGLKDVSLGSVLSDMFENPNIDVQPSNDSVVIVTISGKFRWLPKQDYTESGSIEFSVNLKGKTCDVYSDPNNLHSRFQSYAVQMVYY